MRTYTTDRFKTCALLNRILGLNQNEYESEEYDSEDSEEENLQEKSEVPVENDEDLQEEPENPVEVDEDDNKNGSQAEQPHLTPQGTGQDQ